MTGSLDRLIESGLAALIDAQSVGVQCVPNLRAGGESNATLPRVVVTCESQESPDFQEVPDGIYGVYPVRATVTSIIEATDPSSLDDMTEANSAVDDVIVYSGALAVALTSGTLKVYGVIPGGCRQEHSGNRIIRHREAIIWARVEGVASVSEYELDFSDFDNSFYIPLI